VLNVVLDKAFDFAIRVVNLYKFLCKDKKEYTLSKQLELNLRIKPRRRIEHDKPQALSVPLSIRGKRN
jgi:hypothetical protein